MGNLDAEGDREIIREIEILLDMLAGIDIVNLGWKMGLEDLERVVERVNISMQISLKYNISMQISSK